MHLWKIDKLQSLRRKLKTDQISVGGWQQLNSPQISEILSMGDYDWIVLDWEHGRFNETDLLSCIRAQELYRKLTLIRLPELDSHACKVSLESGAAGVIIPKMETALQAERAMQFLRWPPDGERGVGFSRSNGYGAYFDEMAELNRSPLIIFMIESVKGLNNLEEIVECRSPDAIFIGPYDLSASLGVIGQFESEIFSNAMEQIKVICKKYNISCGLHVINNCDKELQNRMQEGFRFLAKSMDTVQFRETVYKAGEIK